MMAGKVTQTAQRQPLQFTGYAAIFNAVDRGGEIIRPGAFTTTLARLQQKRIGGEPGPVALPLLWQHDARHPVGTVLSLAEDDRGLRVTAQLFAQSPAPLEKVSAGAVSGLSFGYRVAHSRHDRAGRPRELLALDLVEISLVTSPMQPLARIHAVEPVLPP